MNKNQIREIFLKKRDSLSKDFLNKANKTIFTKLINSDIYKSSKVLMIYASFGTEINTHRIINQALRDKKSVLLPITDPKSKSLTPSRIYSFDELDIGYYNILSPKEEFIRVENPNTIDLVVVPGIAFDQAGYRIGYGGGYYDRFLIGLSKIYKLSLAYDFQLVKSLPKEEYDIPVNHLITEKRDLII